MIVAPRRDGDVIVAPRRDGDVIVAPRRDGDEEVVAGLLRADAGRWRVLGLLRDLVPPDGWIGAGFVRNAVWDALHGRPATMSGDIDVIWFDPARADAATDAAQEAALRAAVPGIAWSVRNQARMHARNGDAPYTSTFDAMRHWPETATAVAVRRTAGDALEIMAPYGLDDQLGLRIRPTPGFARAQPGVLERRAAEKRWRTRWPLLNWPDQVPSRASPSSAGSDAPRAAPAPPPAAGR